MKPPKIDWTTAIKPLLKKYKGEKHPLEYMLFKTLILLMLPQGFELVEGHRLAVRKAI